MSDSYAKALVELAEEKNTLESVHADVDTLAGLVSANQKLSELLFNPVVEAGKKRAVVAKISKEAGFQKYTTNFLNLLVAKDRMNLLNEICESFEEQYCTLTDTQVRGAGNEGQACGRVSCAQRRTAVTGSSGTAVLCVLTVLDSIGVEMGFHSHLQLQHQSGSGSRVAGGPSRLSGWPEPLPFLQSSSCCSAVHQQVIAMMQQLVLLPASIRQQQRSCGHVRRRTVAPAAAQQHQIGVRLAVHCCTLLAGQQWC